MPRFTPKNQQQILTKMIAKVVANSDLSDVGDASDVKHVLAAAARSDDEQYYQMTLLQQLFDLDRATGDDLDERAAEIQPGDITRIPAAKATGLVVFSRAGTSGTTAIPIGTKVKTSTGIVFTTTAAGSITAVSPEQIAGHGVGRDSAPVPILADLPGASGNVAPATLVKFGSKPAGIDEVTNLTTCVNGADKELDDVFRERIKDYVRSLARCPADAIAVGVIGQGLGTGETIRFAAVWEDPVNLGRFIVYIDDGTGTAEVSAAVVGENVTAGLSGPPPDSAVGGEERLYLDNKPVKTSASYSLSSSTRGALVEGTDYNLVGPWGLIMFTPALTTGEIITASYTHYTGLLQLAQKLVDGDPNDRENYPGFRAAGTLATVAVPQIQIQTAEASLTVKEGYDADTVFAAVGTATKDYINGLTIGEDVLYAELVRRIKATRGVYNVVMIAPTTDRVILDDQLARITDANITLN